MSTYISSEGAPFEVVHSDRGYGGRQRIVFQVDGRTGDVAVTGRLVVNGVAVVGGPAIGYLVQQTDDFTPAAGQTDFTLSETPVGTVDMYVDGVRQQPGVAFTVSGRAATWLNDGFQLAPTDEVAFVYLR